MTEPLLKVWVLDNLQIRKWIRTFKVISCDAGDREPVMIGTYCVSIAEIVVKREVTDENSNTYKRRKSVYDYEGSARQAEWISVYLST
jgi:hypothetical protein